VYFPSVISSPPSLITGWGFLLKRPRQVGDRRGPLRRSLRELSRRMKIPGHRKPSRTNRVRSSDNSATQLRAPRAYLKRIEYCVGLSRAPSRLVAPLAAAARIPDVLTLETLADVRVLVEKHLPAEYRSKFIWRHLAGLLKRVAEGQQDVSEVSIALKIVLQLEGIRCQ
jgi:hypothetical protein